MMIDRNKSMLLIAAAGFGVYLAARRLKRRSRSIYFQDKVALITGGSRGLGLIMARQLLREGAKVVICSRTREQLERAEAELSQLVKETAGRSEGNGQPRVFAAVCDITDEAQVTNLVNQARQRFGRIDILINNAGIIQVGPAEEMTIEDYREIMEANFWGALYMIHEVLPEMVARRSGGIINIASFGGKVSVPHLLPYSVSKHALVGLSDGLRAAYAKDGLTITTVSPGVMRTGSHINANFKGQSEKEYQWFGFGATTPGFSSDAEKSAALILDQFYRGRAEVIFPIPMSLFIKFRALFPEVSQGLLTLMNRLLPDPLPGDAGQQTIRGRKLGLIPPVSLTPRLGLEIAARNNEL